VPIKCPENQSIKLRDRAYASTAVLFAGTAIAQQNVDFAKVEIKDH
jgi:hypothetical protein